MTTRDDQTLRAQHHLPRTADVTAKQIIQVAQLSGLLWRDAFALVEGESGFHNVFGHDGGGMFPGHKVTCWKTRIMITAVRLGHTSNGVGVTQLTSLPFLLDARRRGGACRVPAQLAVGFELLNNLQGRHGRELGFAAYNGGEGAMHDRDPQRYAQAMMLRAEHWLRVLHG